MARCENCGFLSVRIHRTDDLSGASNKTRQSGSTLPDGGCYGFPVCFMKALDLRSESSTRWEAADKESEFLRVIKKERTCDSWVQWQEGFTPKEHKEMLDQKAQREWQAEQRQRDLAWQEERRIDDRKWQLAQKRWDRAWQLVWLLVGAIISTAVWFAQQHMSSASK